MTVVNLALVRKLVSVPTDSMPEVRVACGKSQAINMSFTALVRFAESDPGLYVVNSTGRNVTDDLRYRVHDNHFSINDLTKGVRRVRLYMSPTRRMASACVG